VGIACKTALDAGKIPASTKTQGESPSGLRLIIAGQSKYTRVPAGRQEKSDSFLDNSKNCILVFVRRVTQGSEAP
jgi:hypothetical protein